MAHPYSRGAHPKWLGREKLADGGGVDAAKTQLAKGLKERDEYLNDPDMSVLDHDRRESTMNAAASGGYDASRTFSPFTPKRGR